MNKHQAGFTYLVALLMVFVLLLGLGRASEHIATANQREREAELIFIGEQYRNAIASYYYNSPDGNKQLPLTLESLLADNRAINHLHHLRKLYRDPITNSAEWGLVKSPQGEITGVYSLSNEQVLSRVNNVNLLENAELSQNTNSENAAELNAMPASYQDWKFIFKPENQDSSQLTNEDENSNKDADEIADSPAPNNSDY